MDFLNLLFEPAVLPFTVPALVSLVFWLLSAIGLLDLRLFDADAHADVHADAHADLHGEAHAGTHGGAGVLHLLGLGVIPLSLVVTLLLCFFGFAGIGLHAAFGERLGALGWSRAAMDLVFAPVALLAGGACSAAAARLLGPLFRDYGEATAARALVGKIGVVKSQSVSPTFGEVTVRTPNGPIDLAARTDGEAVRYGDTVVVLDYDPRGNTYLVERLDLEDDRLPGGIPAPARRLTT